MVYVSNYMVVYGLTEGIRFILYSLSPSLVGGLIPHEVAFGLLTCYISQEVEDKAPLTKAEKSFRF